MANLVSKETLQALTNLIANSLNGKANTTHEHSQYIPFKNEYVSDANSWLTNGYIKTSDTTTNLPTNGSNRWGILFFISENTIQGTGTQMFFPIDGDYKGRVFVRALTNMNTTPQVGEWSILATKSDVDSKADENHTHDILDIDGLADTIGNINSFDVVIVESLPSTDVALTHTIYMVQKTTSGANNVYNEYMFLNGSFEKIGDTEIDLSQYATKTELSNGLGGKADKSHTHAISEITNLQTELNNKSDSTHTHTNIEYNVKDFGALGDGATDATSAIQSAIDTANTNGGGIVHVPSGTYMITTLNMKTDVHLKGDGTYNSILKSTSDNTSTALITHVDGASNFTISDITIHGGNSYAEKQNILTHGIYLHLDTNGGAHLYDHYVRIENVNVVYCGNHGIYEESGRENRYTNVLCASCGGNGFKLIGSDNYLRGCASSNSGLAGFWVQSGNCKMTNCKSWWSGEIDTSVGHGFIFPYGGTSTITNCEAQENSCDGFKFLGGMGWTASNLISDQNNKADVGGVAYNIKNCSEVIITDSIAKNTDGLNGNGHTKAVSISGTSFNNTIDIKVVNGTTKIMDWFDYSESVNICNTIRINDIDVSYPNFITDDFFVDSNNDGIVDCFKGDPFVNDGITAEYKVDDSKKAQKISITASNTSTQYRGTSLSVAVFDVTAGEKISVYAQGMVDNSSLEGIGLIEYKNSNGNVISTVQTMHINVANKWNYLYLINSTIPNNAVSADLFFKCRQGSASSATGNFYIKDIKYTVTGKAPKDTANTIASKTIRNIVALTQTEYDALATKDANTIYLISG